MALYRSSWPVDSILGLHERDEHDLSAAPREPSRPTSRRPTRAAGNANRAIASGPSPVRRARGRPSSEHRGVRRIAPVGLSVMHHFEFRGSRRDVAGKLASLRARFLDLPVRSVSDVLEIESAANPFDRGTGVARFEQKQFALAMLFARLDSQTAWATTDSWAGRIDRIARSGNGLSLRVDVGEGCEPFHVLLGRIGKGRVWRGIRFTKTQYAVHFVDAHLLVVRMLDICREEGILRRVKDDGGYWEKRDLAVLARNLNSSTAMLGAVAKTLGAAGRRRGMRVEAAIDRCRNRIRVKGRDRGPPAS